MGGTDRARTLAVAGVLDGRAAEHLTAALLMADMTGPGQDVTLHVDSPGGPFTAFEAVYDTLSYLTSPVVTVCVGRAGGTAAALLAAGTPGRRYAVASAVVTIVPSGVDPVRPDAAGARRQAAELDRADTRMVQVLARHTGLPPAVVIADLEVGGRHLGAEEARRYGLVDAVLRH